MRRWIAAVVTCLLLTAGALAAQPEPTPVVPTPDAPPAALIQAQATISAFSVQTERDLAELDERIEVANQVVDRAFDLLNLFQVLGGILALVGVAGVFGALQTWWRLQATTNRVERDIRHAIDERRREMRELAIASATITSLLDLAQRQYRGGDRAGAIAVLESAAEQDRQIAEQISRGDTVLKRNAAPVEDEVTLVGNNPRVHYLLGYYLEKDKQYDAALAALEKALKIDPDYHPALAAKGLVVRRLAQAAPEAERGGRYASAAKLIYDALGSGYDKLLDEDGESWYGSLGGLYAERKDYKNAIENYELAAKIVKESSYPLVNLALLLLEHGDDEQKARADGYFKDAVEIAERRVKITPKDLYLFSDLIIGYAAVGDEKSLKDAIAQYRKLGGKLDDPIKRLTRLGKVLPLRLPVIDTALDLLK